MQTAHPLQHGGNWKYWWLKIVVKGEKMGPQRTKTIPNLYIVSLPLSYLWQADRAATQQVSRVPQA